MAGFSGPPFQTVEIADPGNGNAITSTSDSAIIAIDSAGAETRTLDDPTGLAQHLTVYDRVHGGTVSVFASTALDASGNNRIDLTAARAIIGLISILHAGIFKWQVAWKSPEVTLSSP